MKLDRAFVERRAWQLTSIAAGAAAALVVRRATTLAWRTRHGDAPAALDTDRSVALRDALMFAAALGAGTAVARVVAQRTAARAWEAATGTPPEQLVDDE